MATHGHRKSDIPFTREACLSRQRLSYRRFLHLRRDSNYAKMMVSHLYWEIIKKQPRNDAKTIVKDFLENGNTKNSMPWAANLLSPEGIDLTNNIYGIFDELFNTVSSLTDLTSMQMRFTTEKVAKGVSVVGLGIALTQLGLDFYNSKGMTVLRQQICTRISFRAVAHYLPT